jgi:threonine/homoserine/homoserine lactone efflux protein
VSTPKKLDEKDAAEDDTGKQLGNAITAFALRHGGSKLAGGVACASIGSVLMMLTAFMPEEVKVYMQVLFGALTVFGVALIVLRGLQLFTSRNRS